MEDYRDSQTCKAKTGLLFLRDCGSMVKTNCGKCGRPVCREHAIETEDGTVCPECAAPMKSHTSAPGVRNSVRRNDYYNHYGYAPYYYGHTHYYSDHDYRTFDGGEMVYEDPPTGGMGSDDDDSYMES